MSDYTTDIALAQDSAGHVVAVRINGTTHAPAFVEEAVREYPKLKTLLQALRAALDLPPDTPAGVIGDVVQEVRRQLDKAKAELALEQSKVYQLPAPLVRLVHAVRADLIADQGEEIIERAIPVPLRPLLREALVSVRVQARAELLAALATCATVVPEPIDEVRP